jgi:predicted DCC family thiol-disulfide oxidoreductase YuxK
MPNNRTPTLIALYDHDCPLCRTELLALKASDMANRLKLINIRDPNFSAHAWGFAPEALETTLHVRDPAGYWHIGMDAIRLVYREVGAKTPLARALKHTDLPGLRFVFDRLYANLANNRLAVSGALAKYLGYGLIGHCSNDECLVTETNDDKSRA